MTMVLGLEARTPFLDHELLELAARCPPELKLAEGGKGVLKRAARDVLPDAVIDRPKGYFPVPALSHLEGPVLDLVAEALHAPAARAVPPRRRRRDARRAERAPHEPRRLGAVAARAARAVAADAPRRLRR
jgi:asparagine synthetase B (glutamine-hydrolysing)